MNRNSYELSRYRLEKAKEDLSTAIENLENMRLSGSINKSFLLAPPFALRRHSFPPDLFL